MAFCYAERGQFVGPQIIYVPGGWSYSVSGTQRLTDRVATLSLTVDNYDPSDVGTLLDVGYGIQTRTGLHCAPLMHEHMGTTPRGTVRLSAGPFNTDEHIETTIKAIGEIAADRPTCAKPKDRPTEKKKGKGGMLERIKEKIKENTKDRRGGGK